MYARSWVQANLAVTGEERLVNWIKCWQNPLFARLYGARTIDLLGDALTWLGLALLAFELAQENAGAVLAAALTLRVSAFALLSPLAGAMADRVDRKWAMVGTHLARMVLVCLLPFVTQIWQIYPIVLALNIFAAFFSPTYTATIPLVTSIEERSSAIALSSATYQLLGVLGPGLAGAIAAIVGTRQVFFLDGITFGIAAIAIATLPATLKVDRSATVRAAPGIWQDIRAGSQCLFADPTLRYALLMQLVAAIAGAEILVNTVSYVRGELHLGKLEYGWAMAAFGCGATLASLGLGQFARDRQRLIWIGSGAISITLALLGANWVNLGGLLVLWSIAGIGQTCVNVPTQMAIADRVAVAVQGRVYGAQFAWSHLWWVFAYPLAGWLGRNFPHSNFWLSSIGGLAVAIAIYFICKPDRQLELQGGIWHEHDLYHDALHYPIGEASTPVAPSSLEHRELLHFHAIDHPIEPQPIDRELGRNTSA